MFSNLFRLWKGLFNNVVSICGFRWSDFYGVDLIIKVCKNGCRHFERGETVAGYGKATRDELLCCPCE